MSEEKPTFKITDRRLFNADGSPRDDIVREEEPTPEPPETEPREAAAESAEPYGEDTSAPEGGAAQAARARDAGGAETEQEFLMLVEFVASFAADAMGMVNHGGAAGSEVNLPLAQQCIGMLSALQKKTRGQLSAEEQRFLDMILTQLRMQYVSLTSAPRGGGPAGPRNFSGGDITGGR